MCCFVLSSVDGSLPQPPKQKEWVALWRAGCYRKGGFFWAWSFMGLTSPFFSWYASNDWWRFLYLVVPLPPCGTSLLGCLFASNFGPFPLSLFLSFFFGCFLFVKFCEASSKASDFQCAKHRERFTMLWWT